jgi:Family of unknown function (DUF6111)
MLGRVFVEALLFLAPFAVFLVYRAASRDLKVRDRWPLTRLVIIGAVIAGLALIITPLLEPSEATKCLADPVRYEDGKEIRGVEVPCDQLKPAQPADPSTTTTTTRPPPTSAPVAPRDQGR